MHAHSLRCYDIYVERTVGGRKHRLFLCFPRAYLQEGTTRARVAEAVNAVAQYRTLRSPGYKRACTRWARMPYGGDEYIITPGILDENFMRGVLASRVSGITPGKVSRDVLWEAYKAELERRDKEELRKQLTAKPEKRRGA